MDILIQVVLLAAGFAMLIKGADCFVDGASRLADRFGIPQLIIGLTIVAMGTSAPEAAVSISAALQGNAGITIGNVVGSNILNILLILGVTSCIRAIAVQKSTIKYEIPFMIGMTVLLVFFGLADKQVSRLEGGVLWIFLIVYLAYLLKMAKQGQENGGEDGKTVSKETKKEDKMWKLVLLIAAGLALIVCGSNVTVDAATAIADRLGVDDRIIGLTVVALGTSLPELVTSITAAVKGKADIAVGNIVGSNLFNILFIVGMTALIIPIPYSADFLVDSITVIAASALLLICVVKNKRLGRAGGAVMLAGYAAYFIYLICG